MIAYIRGRLAEKEPTYVVIETAGIGYNIRISLNTYDRLKDQKEEVRLATYLQVKEDSHTLFGFFDISEKKLFTQLISVNGVGANTAMVMLSSMEVKALKEAIVAEDVKTVQKIKGIGAKTAQRIILELKDKFIKEGLEAPAGGTTAKGSQVQEEALMALTTLGIPKATAEKSIATIIKKHGSDVTVEDIIKLALKN
ncbi:Holliday junction branch migration protein RuvA [Persicobacter psychrovividus]|uniref:Holliday junction branch migration complex subunit RuvA n=1 Tax=Persicobacter psychrovividus TaxID=387638 RepID=A0ABM7VAL6_9BACT|nr:Holliday junction ATP-dependent DNA helicase RuvA [Persicobacter psychrovividus]